MWFGWFWIEVGWIWCWMGLVWVGLGWAALCCVVLGGAGLRCYAVLCCVVLCCVVLCRVVLCCVLYCVVLGCVVLGSGIESLKEGVVLLYFGCHLYVERPTHQHPPDYTTITFRPLADQAGVNVSTNKAHLEQSHNRPNSSCEQLGTKQKHTTR